MVQCLSLSYSLYANQLHDGFPVVTRAQQFVQRCMLSSKMAANGESKLLEIINTKYKKNAGILHLLTNRIVWTPQGTTTPKIDCKYSEIKVQRISPEGSSKIQLQVVLHDGNSYSFQFTNPSPETAKNERNEVKDLLAQLIPAHRMKANKELEEKNKILKENPDVYQLYKDLVVSGVITSEEFWANRGKVSESMNVDSQSVGISSVLLGDAQPMSSGCNEVKYNLNADTIEAIFRTYPAVKKKHAEVVPDKMTEKEFWTKFFQSHYFHRDRTSKITATDMFTECAKQDEHEQLTSGLNNLKDHMLDLTGISPLPDEGYGCLPVDDQSDQSAKSTSGQSLFRRLNHHSLMVLQTTQKSRDKPEIPETVQNGDVKTQSDPPAKKSRLREVIELEDLQQENEVQTQNLKIAGTSKYSAQDNEHENGFSSHSNKTTIDCHTALEHCKYEIKTWTSQLTEVLSSDQACHVLTEMSPGGSLMDSTSQTNIQHSLSESLFTELKQQYNALAELLRHFWLCFPTTTPFLEEKLVRMGHSLQKYSDKLQQLKGKLPQEEQHLTNHLSLMLQTALTKFQTWEEKKSKSKKTS